MLIGSFSAAFCPLTVSVDLGYWVNVRGAHIGVIDIMFIDVVPLGLAD